MMPRAVSHVVAAFLGITMMLCLACAALVPAAQADDASDEAAPVEESAADESAEAEEAEQDYVTVSGLDTIGDETVFSSLYEALLACAEAIEDDPSLPDGGITLLIHGTMVLDRDLPTQDRDTLAEEITGTVLDGLNWAVMGADPDATLIVSPDDSADGATLFNPGGMLLLRSLTIEGSLMLEARDGLVVDFCTFDHTLTYRTDGALVGIASNVFTAEQSDVGYAAVVELGAGESTAVLFDNEIYGFSSAFAVNDRSADYAQVTITSNVLDLVPPEDAASAADACVLRLQGGPWPASSIISGGNIIDGPTALIVLDGSFSVITGTGDEAHVLSIADDSLDAAAIEALFELADDSSLSESPDEAVRVCLDADFDGTSAAQAAAEASEAILPTADTTVGLEEPISYITVVYDANGATTGVAPGPVSVEAGATIAVETMGSLAYPGYMFEGWNTEPDGSGTFYAVGQIMSPQADMTLYAQWASTGTVATVPVQAAAEAAESAEAEADADFGEAFEAPDDEIAYTEVASS